MRIDRSRPRLRWRAQRWRSRAAASLHAAAGKRAAAVSDAAFHRLERTVAREQAVRYLNDAQDVLVNVAATLPHCQRHDRHFDVAAETLRSRELLARRALRSSGVTMLQAPARCCRTSSKPCEPSRLSMPARTPTSSAAIQAELSRRRLLMKIDLMTRELQG